MDIIPLQKIKCICQMLAVYRAHSKMFYGWSKVLIQQLSVRIAHWYRCAKPLYCSWWTWEKHLKKGDLLPNVSSNILDPLGFTGHPSPQTSVGVCLGSISKKIFCLSAKLLTGGQGVGNYGICYWYLCQYPVVYVLEQGYLPQYLTLKY